MAKATTYIKENGKAAAVKGVKATYNKETKSYEVKATLEIAAKWYKARVNKKGEITREERVVFTCKGMSVVATRNGSKIKLSPVQIAKAESYDQESREVLEKKAKASADILKPYLLNKFNMKDMNWETLVRKLESLVAVVEVATEDIAA